ncbi:2-succinyl-6-hydroxy-2,4-cyclohexadiene-1-carboxylate synthase [Lysinibacillus sp. KU-BSD001]|uniref:2-succinyl-6-hydroxy-2, 4-cyclohexadiene-1-carboxylate synthase n=1 Tax=Lysinibacillus sp. KU-BSD001 TaxID=3141328 RepID=UPI0036E1BEC1
MATVTALGIDVHVETWHDEQVETIVMLHGFTGSTNTWAQVAQKLPQYRIVAIDCMGHGKTESPNDFMLYTMEQQLAVLEEVFCRLFIQNFTLIGYSMGGRIALSYAIQYPERVRQLILESASPGLRTEEERKARKEADDKLAQKIEAAGVVNFVREWENIQLFASQKKLPLSVQQAIRTERLNQSAQGLANSLRGIGTGMMPSVWDRLHRLLMPVTLITGELDEKFVSIAWEMAQVIPKVRHLTVNNAGHAIHVENPTEFATIVKDTISLK